MTTVAWLMYVLVHAIWLRTCLNIRLLTSTQRVPLEQSSTAKRVKCLLETAVCSVITLSNWCTVLTVLTRRVMKTIVIFIWLFIHISNALHVSNLNIESVSLLSRNVFLTPLSSDVKHKSVYSFSQATYLMYVTCAGGTKNTYFWSLPLNSLVTSYTCNTDIYAFSNDVLTLTTRGHWLQRKRTLLIWSDTFMAYCSEKRTCRGFGKKKKLEAL